MLLFFLIYIFFFDMLIPLHHGFRGAFFYPDTLLMQSAMIRYGPLLRVPS